MSKAWTLQQIDTMKSNVRGTLAKFKSDDDTKLTLDYVLDRLGEISTKVDSDSRLEAHVLAITALLHHATHGGLKQNQIRSLEEIVETGIKLYAGTERQNGYRLLSTELYSALSQVDRREGDHWSAAWHTHIAARTVQKIDENFFVSIKFSAANRAFRLGDRLAALGYLQEIEETSPSSAMTHRVELLRILMARLSGALDEAKERSAILARETTDDRIADELKWENACLVAQESGELMSMMSLLRPKGSLRQASYMLEGVLWSNSVQVTRFLKHLPSIQTIFRTFPGASRDLGVFGKLMRSFDSALDQDRPFELRRKFVGQVIHEVNTVNSIEREMLLLVACGRWLYRTKSPELGRLALNEYRVLSLKLTNFQSKDVLNLIADLGAD